ncbi:sensor histidine kinase [Nonomuraea soli]|uniref:histidine kinase n=1 Tax=Nonomuraea soli TaxID=1032476 RepID=A0A7W0CJP6_9ACTN|nr:histidine kinase [Nonomuraea soli]MBA2892411.1 signal transduction histidine kinase [Nonomuraea soli]
MSSWLALLRPDRRRPRPSRRALAADVLVALVLTVLAVSAAPSGPGGAHRVPLAESLRLQPLPVPSAAEAQPVVPTPDPAQGPLLPLVIATALPLAARRLSPLGVFWVVLPAALVMHDDATWITVATCSLAAYSAVAHSRHQGAAIGALAVATVLAGVAFQDSVGRLPAWLGPFTVLLSAGVAAGSVRLWRRRSEEASRAQERAMSRAVERERSRIARELHDVVTHNVNVMVIQAGAARKVMDAAPERSKQAMMAVEASGRAAMAELRHVMGLLAGPGEPGRTPADGLEPQPGLDQLDSLIERVRAAGVTVSAEVAAPPEPLPPGVELAAYRVVQEALTNVMKHADGARASVTIRYHEDGMEIEISDSGGKHAARAAAGQGRGLAGLRERLAIYGGALRAGPEGDGYLVRAHLPWGRS